MPTNPAKGETFASQRGASLSVFSVALIPALVLATGLAVDGSAQARGMRSAESVAAMAARVASDAAAGERALGRADGAQAALSAAEQVLAGHQEFSYTLAVVNGELRVAVAGQVSTIFLSLAGIKQLPVKGSAAANVVG